MKGEKMGERLGSVGGSQGEGREVRTCRRCGKKLKKGQKFFCSYDCRFAKEETPSAKKYHRTCHDCGKPTNDFRCLECWEKLRSKLGIPKSSNSNEED